MHLFAGFAHCACGHKMYVPSRTPRYRCWTCNNQIPTADLEAIYHDQLKGFLFSDEQIAAHLEKADRILAEKQDTTQHIEGERDSVRREMEKLYRLYLDNQITSAGFGARNPPLEERLTQLEAELPAAQAALDVLRIGRLASDQILAEARSLHTRWPNLSKDDKRAIVEAITERIVVGSDTVDITLNTCLARQKRPLG